MDRSARFARWAWLPLGVLALTIAAAALVRSRSTPVPWLLNALLELMLIAGPALWVAWRSARAFVEAGSRGILLLGCGALAFGLAVGVGRFVAPDREAELMALFELGLLASALLHLFGVIAMHQRLEPGQRVAALAAGYGASALVVASIALLVERGAMPLWFVTGDGGSALRQSVVAGAALLFGIDALLLARRARSSPQRVFARWYAPGLGLLALGLVGMLPQLDGGGLLGALVFTALALGALYLAVAWLRLPPDAAGDPPPLSLADAPHDWRLRYGLAFVFVAIATLLRLIFFDVLGTSSPYAHAIPAVVMAALYGGWGPALLALLLSLALANAFWVEPIYELSLSSPREVASALVYLISSSIVVAVVLMLQRARLRLQRAETQREMAEERARDAEAARDAAERLRSTEERYRALFDSVDQGACLCEIVCDDMGLPTDFRFLEVNPAFAAVTGLPAGVAGRRAGALRAERPVHWIVPYARAALGGESLQFEECSLAPGREFEVFAAPLPPRGRFVLLLTDVTQRRLAEAARRRAAAFDAFRVALDDALRPLSDAAAVQAAACRVVGEHLLVQRALFAEVNEREEFVIGPDWVDGAPHLAGRYRAADFGPQVMRQFRAGQPFVVADTEADAGLDAQARASFAALQMRSAAAVPLLKGDRLIGAFGVTHDAPRAWSDEQVAWLQEAAERTWSAVQRARAEAALRHSESVFRTLGEALPDAMWMADADGSPIYQNPAWAAFYALTPQQLRDGGWQQIVHPQDLPRISAAWNSALADPAPFEIEYRARRHDGQYRWCSARTVPVRDEHGVLTRWVSVATDVHERKLAAQALADSVQREQARADELEVFMQAAPVAVWIARDPDCKHIWSNEYGHRLLRVPARSNVSITAPPEQRAVAFRAFVEGREVAPEDMPMQRCGRTGERVDGLTMELRFDDGHTVTEVINAVPLKDTEGRVRGVIAVALDISERVAAERALVEADRRKNEFIAMLAHELRNPLAPVRNAVAVIDRLRGDQPRLQWACAVIERQMQQMSRLIDDLLDVSRITQGLIALKTEPTDLAAVLRAALETSRPLIEQARHTLELRLPDAPLWTLGDPTRLAQVFSNLLNNAAKYSEPGGHITLETEVQGGQVRVAVIDRGIGIAPAMLERVFELFEQADRSAARSHGGLGIGLTLVKRLVELHGGTVAAFSEGLGRGSRFEVRLPLHDVAPAPSVAAPRAEPRRSGRRILVVDDNRDAGQTLAAVLETMGNDVRNAYDGEQALALASEFEPEIVLLDLGMPRMDGWEAARRMRSQPWGARATLIATTGWGHPEDRRRTAAAGFDHHLVKPLDPQQLMRLIEAVPA